MDNWPDGGIECNVLFTIDGKGGDVSEELWNRCLTRLEDELPSQQFNMWIRPLQVTASEDGGELTLFAPNRFVVDWVRDKYVERISEVLGELKSGPLPQLRLEVGSSRAAPAPRQPEAGAARGRPADSRANPMASPSACRLRTPLAASAVSSRPSMPRPPPWNRASPPSAWRRVRRVGAMRRIAAVCSGSGA